MVITWWIVAFLPSVLTIKDVFTVSQLQCLFPINVSFECKQPKIQFHRDIIKTQINPLVSFSLLSNPAGASFCDTLYVKLSNKWLNVNK